MADETRQLAEFAASLSCAQIPAHVHARAIDLIVDQIGVEIGCAALPWSQQVREIYVRTGGVAEATVVRYGDRLPAQSAAFVNSTFGHAFEYDDGNPQFHGHPGAELIPPLLAIGEREHIAGRELFTAFVAAYELRGRIGWALSPDMVQRGGPQYSTTCGPFGAAVAVARLLGLGAEGIHNAMGIAGAFSGGLMQYDHGGGSVKRIYCAVPAAAGLHAAQLAAAGLTGPEGILEGARGLLRIYAKEYRPERLVAGFGSKWMFETIYFKPYCCLGIIAAAIDGLTRIRDAQRLRAEDIESIVVHYPTGFHEHAAIDAPRDLLAMQFSTSYSLALTMLKGGNTSREYTMDALGDPGIRAFASKVRIREDKELTRRYEGHLPARVEVLTRGGAHYSEFVPDAKGSPRAPMSSAEIDTKFRSQVASVLGAERCEQLLRTLRGIDTLDDVAKIPPMLVADRGSAPPRE